MALLSRRHRFLYLMAPRTGSTALSQGVLIPKFEAEWLPPEHIFDDKGNRVVDRKHTTLSELLRHGLLSNADAKDLFKFTTVRNPFDSVVTHYSRLRFQHSQNIDQPHVQQVPGYKERILDAVELDFNEWVLHRWVGQASWKRPWAKLTHGLPRSRHMYAPYIEGADYVMRFERLQEDFDEVCRKIGIPSVEIPKKNVTGSRESDYRTYYSDEARRVVEHVFRLDMQRFGYSF